ncbi:MAG: hypothetical protein ACKOU7_02670 [Ferruginibacter sp.]
MNKQEQINKLVEEALESVVDAQRAEAKPYLFTRLQARMNKETESAWEKAGWFITRPAVAFAVICLVVLFNATVIFYNKTSIPVANTDVAVQNTSDEFSYTVSGIYDIENTQP